MRSRITNRSIGVRTKNRRFAALASALCGVSAFLASQLFAQDPSVPRVPLTLEKVQHTFGDAGVLEERIIEAVRDDGSTVRVTQHRSSDGDLKEIRTVVDLQSGRKIVLTSSAKSTTTYTYTDEHLRALRERSLSCPKAGETDRIMGHDVVSVARDRTGAPGNFYREVSWHAPSLGCIPLEDVVRSIEADGTERVIKTTEVVRIDVGEPDPALFSIPSDYTEMSPAEYAAEMGQEATQLVQQLNSTYQSNRAESRR